MSYAKRETLAENVLEGMNSLLAANWWAVALRGIVAILFGFIAFLAPATALLSLVIVFGAYMVADGVFDIIAAIRAARRNERWTLLVLEGVVDIVAGAIAFLWPGITVFAFVILIAARSLISGVLMLSASFRLKLEHGRWWLAIGGVASIIFAVLLVIAPFLGALVLTWWLGAYAIVFGVSLLMLAFKLYGHRTDHEHPMHAQPA